MLRFRTTLRLSSNLVQNEETLRAIWLPLELSEPTPANLAVRKHVLRVIRAAYNPILTECINSGGAVMHMFRGRSASQEFQDAVLGRIRHMPERFQYITSHQETILGEALYDILRFYRFTDGEYWLRPVTLSDSESSAEFDTSNESSDGEYDNAQCNGHGGGEDDGQGEEESGEEGDESEDDDDEDEDEDEEGSGEDEEEDESESGESGQSGESGESGEEDRESAEEGDDSEGDDNYDHDVTFLTNGDLTNGDLTNGDLANGNLTNGNLTNGYLTNGNLTNGILTNGCNGDGSISGHKRKYDSEDEDEPNKRQRQ
ncbi:hypothetical protein N7535_005696 [Penicillium sp. DV-2018c]|nr:hypothetical protein N7461_009271 [Penicillium sp. DV-2018c]KAJ5572036.1 hypothetical protein N7535_005696 [Penicillium sp. DV-2018c]